MVAVGVVVDQLVNLLLGQDVNGKSIGRSMRVGGVANAASLIVAMMIYGPGVLITGPTIPVFLIFLVVGTIAGVVYENYLNKKESEENGKFRNSYPA